MTQYMDPHSPQAPVGDPDDPMTPTDLDALAAHEAQDAAYEREQAAQAMLEAFLAGIAASDGLGTFEMENPAFQLGDRVGWLIRGQIALKPELAPLWDALVKS